MAHISLPSRRFLHTTSFGSKIVHFIFNKLAQSSVIASLFITYSTVYILFSLLRTQSRKARRYVQRRREIRCFGELEPMTRVLWIRSLTIHSSVAAKYRPLLQPELLDTLKMASLSIWIMERRFLRQSWFSPLDGKALGRRFSMVGIYSHNSHSFYWYRLTGQTASELGIGRHLPTTDVVNSQDLWNYKTLSDPPPTHQGHQKGQFVTSIYRGLIPGKNLNNRDFAIAGAIVSPTSLTLWSFEVHSMAFSSPLTLGTPTKLLPTGYHPTFKVTVCVFHLTPKRLLRMLSYARRGWSGDIRTCCHG